MFKKEILSLNPIYHSKWLSCSFGIRKIKGQDVGYREFWLSDTYLHITYY